MNIKFIFLTLLCIIFPTLSNAVEIDEELECLATAIYFESRGEPVQGQLAVAEVILNRVKDRRFPDTICGVVKEGYKPGRTDCQFSFFCDGMPDIPTEKEAWISAKLLADIMYNYKDIYSDKSSCGGAVYFHANYSDPHWNDHFSVVCQVKNHIFYKD